MITESKQTLTYKGANQGGGDRIVSTPFYRKEKEKAKKERKRRFKGNEIQTLKVAYMERLKLKALERQGMKREIERPRGFQEKKTHSCPFVEKQ